MSYELLMRSTTMMSIVVQFTAAVATGAQVDFAFQQLLFIA